jgi:hypothetical protein
MYICAEPGKKLPPCACAAARLRLETWARADIRDAWRQGYEYDDLRAVCPAFPADVYTTLSNPGCVAAVMGHSAQAALANTLFHMKVRRSELLELPWV